MWIYLPRVLEREAIALSANKAESVARLTAFTIHPAIYFQDRAALEEALNGTRRDEDVAYIIVTAPDGTVLASDHPERASGGGMQEAVMPIRDGERQIATLRIGLSLARLRREIMSMRIAIGVLIAVMSAAALLAVLLISNVLTRPLREVTAAAEEIAAGDLSRRVPEHGTDEVGRLASSFNNMAIKIAERDASLREMSKRLLSAQEQERIRIAREVHDELGQALTSLKIDLQGIGRPDVGKNIDGIVDLVRRIATDLRPSVLDDLGVTAALEQQLRRLRESSGITTTLHVDEEPALDMLTSVTLYRIAQEALANIVRHANATNVEVTLSALDGAAILRIRDNGRGMASGEISSRQSLGIVGMRERAELLGGSVTIDTAQGGGTTLTARLPLAKDGGDVARAMR
jgi:signal transduction histidine kinase